MKLEDLIPQTQYPKIISLVKTRENSQWDIGDALLEECGLPSTHGTRDNSRAMLSEVAAEIEELGIEGYSIGALASLRVVSARFPRDSRESLISWTCHRDAGSPQMLQRIKAKAEKEKKRITNSYVIIARRELEEEDLKRAPLKGRTIHDHVAQLEFFLEEFKDNEIEYDLGDEERALVAERCLVLGRMLMEWAQKVNPNRLHIKAVGD